MKIKNIKAFVIISTVLVLAFIFIPEIEIKQSRKDSVKYIASEMGYSPSICSFLVNTKVGRKLCFIGFKKEMKSQLKGVKKSMKKAKRNL